MLLILLLLFAHDLEYYRPLDHFLLFITPSLLSALGPGGRKEEKAWSISELASLLPFLCIFPIFSPFSNISGVPLQCWHLSSWSREGRGGKIKSLGIVVAHFAPWVCGAWERGRAELLSASRGMGLLLLPFHTSPCWLALLVGNCLSMELIKCRSELHSLGSTDSSWSSVLQIGIEDFMCFVFSGKGKLTSWLNPKEWSGWQSLYMGWGLIWL